MIGSVYFLTDGERIKIGFSTDPMARLKSLQTAHGRELRLIGCLPGNIALERSLHERFDAHRVLGEWFEATPDLLSVVQALILDPPPIPAPRWLQPDAGDDELCGRLFIFLRQRHPDRTADAVARVTGVPRQTISKWFERSSFPAGKGLLQLLDAYGLPLLEALLAPPPEWLTEASAQQRSIEIANEIGALVDEFRAINVRPATGPPAASDPGGDPSAPAQDTGPQSRDTGRASRLPLHPRGIDVTGG